MVYRYCQARSSRLHLMGLVQDQGVHAIEDHLFALLDFCAHHRFDRVFIHFFADGRDTPPQSAPTYLDRLEKKLSELGVGRVASVIGRYYAMDRDRRWERTKRAYDALVHGIGLRAASAREAIEAAYRRRLSDSVPVAPDASAPAVETDEFIQPTLIVGVDAAPIATIAAGDAVIHFNYRQDRAIQLTKAFFGRAVYMIAVGLAATAVVLLFRRESRPPISRPWRLWTGLTGLSSFLALYSAADLNFGWLGLYTENRDVQHWTLFCLWLTMWLLPLALWVWLSLRSREASVTPRMAGLYWLILLFLPAVLYDVVMAPGLLGEFLNLPGLASYVAGLQFLCWGFVRSITVNPNNLTPQ